MNASAPDPVADDAVLPAHCCIEIRRLLGYWRSIAAGHGLPARRHLDPASIPDLLPHLWMIDVFRDPWRFRFRLIGTAIVAFTGRDSTGRWCDEVYPDFLATEGYRYMRDCAAQARPLFRTGQLLSNPDRSYVTAQRLYLPLATDGATPDIILAMTRYMPLATG